MFKADARFLVVDDAANARDQARIALNRIGFMIVDEAANGASAVDKVKRAIVEKKPYALVFLDINMPEMDGLQCLEQMRSVPQANNLPVVVITTESAKPTVVRAVMQGVSGYIVKPFTVDDIKKKVAEIFERAQTIASHSE